MASKRGAAAEELNLVPIMNLVTILIPFLLMAAEFVSVAVIDSTLPAIGAPSTAEEKPEEEKKPLNLSVIITGSGYTVGGSAAVLQNREGDGPTIPCKDVGCPKVDSYDVAELQRLLGEIKDEYADEQNVILVPGSRIAYEVIVVTMDATREDPSKPVDGRPRDLFPYVVIAGGAQ